MSDRIFTFQSWPQAILHVDGDAFFTSCEETIHPELRGRPIVTGGERGIIACASYTVLEPFASLVSGPPPLNFTGWDKNCLTHESPPFHTQLIEKHVFIDSLQAIRILP